MKEAVFITGNDKKAEYLSKLLGFHIEHQKVDLSEIQSLDLVEIVEHKLEAAYREVGCPVLVEDVSLEFTAFGKLPGTFIKWFQAELPYEVICRLLDGKDRAAVARSVFGYFDGETKTYFHGALKGTISKHPAGINGFGWDQIFIPDGYSVTRAELSSEDDEATYMLIKPIEKIRNFLLT